MSIPEKRCDRQIAKESSRCEDDQTKVGLHELAPCGGILREIGRAKTPKGTIVELKCDLCHKHTNVME